MKTNDLFRDLLDNKIPGHVTPTTVWIDITPRFDFQPHSNSHCVTADPRARALAAKRDTSHGPQQSASWRGRGRVTKYKES